jgi:hypothetical protein
MNNTTLRKKVDRISLLSSLDIAKQVEPEKITIRQFSQNLKNFFGKNIPKTKTLENTVEFKVLKKSIFKSVIKFINSRWKRKFKFDKDTYKFNVETTENQDEEQFLLKINYLNNENPIIPKGDINENDSIYLNTKGSEFNKLNSISDSASELIFQKKDYSNYSNNSLNRGFDLKLMKEDSVTENKVSYKNYSKFNHLRLRTTFLNDEENENSKNSKIFTNSSKNCNEKSYKNSAKNNFSKFQKFCFESQPQENIQIVSKAAVVDSAPAKIDLTSFFNSPWSKTLLVKNSNKIPLQKDRELNSFKNVYDSISSDEYKSDDEEGFLIMHEDSPFRETYDGIMLACILFSVTVAPVYIAFSLESDIITVIETLMDALFITEIILNFFTPYKVGEKEIKNQKKMALHYLKTRFFFDAISSIPNSLMSALGISNMKSLRLLKVVRMIKLVKWLGALKVSNKEQDDLEDGSFDRIIKFMLFFIILTHISTCVWIYVGLSLESREQSSWVAVFGLLDNPNFDIYVCSLYYNMVTITTIGYGDIRSTSVEETLYIIFFMFISTLLWSYTVSAISQIFLNNANSTKNYAEKMQILSEINEKHKLPQEIYDKLQNIIASSKVAGSEKFEFLDNLPYALKKECLISMSRKGIRCLNFFKNQQKEFLIFCLPLLYSKRLKKDETLISFGDFIEEMYIVKKGVLAIRLGEELAHVEVSQVPEKNHFGELFMYLNENSQYLVNCRTNICDLFCISKHNFTKIKMSYNDIILATLSKSCVFLERIEKLKNIVVEFFNFGLTIKQIKTLIKKINFFSFHEQFDSFLKMEVSGNATVEIEEVEDFILSNDVIDIVDFLNSCMNYEDFLRCFYVKIEHDQNLIQSSIIKNEIEKFSNNIVLIKGIKHIRKSILINKINSKIKNEQVKAQRFGNYRELIQNEINLNNNEVNINDKISDNKEDCKPRHRNVSFLHRVSNKKEVIIEQNEKPTQIPLIKNNTKRKTKFNNDYDLSAIDKGPIHENFNEIKNENNNLLQALPGKKSLLEKLGFKSKSRDTIFNEVIKGLYVDELFLTDKHLLKEKIELVLNERRQMKESAVKAFKKLDNMIFFIKEVNSKVCNN